MYAKEQLRRALNQFYPPALVEQMVETHVLLDFLGPQETAVYASYLSYKAQRAYYTLCREWPESADMRWNEFVLLVRCSETLRDHIKDTICNVVAQFNTSLFRFRRRKTEAVPKKRAQDKMIKMAQLFTEEEGERLILLFMLHAEYAQFTYLSRTKPDYTWSVYLSDLKRDRTLVEALSGAFQDGIRKINFKSELSGTNNEPPDR